MNASPPLISGGGLKCDAFEQVCEHESRRHRQAYNKKFLPQGHVRNLLLTLQGRLLCCG
jgi:hypothetical protein